MSEFNRSTYGIIFKKWYPINIIVASIDKDLLHFKWMTITIKIALEI